MARNIRWFVTFKSLNGTDCRINIYDNDWPEGVTMSLRGAAEPFTYEESYSSDLLEDVIRYRTGYIRVIEDVTYGRLNDIYPEHTFDRYVEFFYGNHLEFNGYIQVQNFSNTLEPTPRVIELPVISPLGLFSKRTFPQILPPTTKTLGELLDIILAGSRYEKVTMPYISTAGLWQTIYSLVVSPWNNDYHHSMTYDAMHLVMRPESYEYLIEGICKAFGWICHDTPTALVFTSFDHEGLYCYYEVGHIGDANYRHYENISQTEEPLTDYYSLADDNARQDTLLPETGIEVSYEGELGADFSFKRTYYVNIERDPNDTGDPDEKFSVCNLFPVPQTFEISNVGHAEFDQQGRIDHGSAVVAWNGKIGVMCSLSTSYQDGFTLFSIRLYRKKLPNSSWTINFSAMASSDGEGTYNSAIGALRDDSKISDYYVQTYLIGYDNYVEVSFKYRYNNTDYPQLPDYTLIFIHSIKFNFLEHNEPYADYRFLPASESDFIPNVNAHMSASVNMPISFYRYNSNLIGDTLLSSKLTEYQYLFRKRLELEGKFRAATAASPDLYHARMFSYMSKKWRLVALDFNPWDDEYTLKMQYSEIFDLVKHSITASAVNTSLDGYTDNVYDGTPFSHLLTSDTGYSITSVVITMGSIDITGTAYDSTTGQISIASVTGDVVITAVTEERAYDAQVEYLESTKDTTGRPHIDTQIPPSSNITFDISFRLPNGSTAHPLGGRISSSSGQIDLYVNFESARYTWGWGSQRVHWNSAPSTSDTIAKNTSTPRICVVNGHSISATANTFENLHSIFLFAVNDAGTPLPGYENAIIRINYCKLYSYGTLIRDFIPVRKNGVGYMYDKVSGQLFGNAGAGQFTYGNDVNP